MHKNREESISLSKKLGAYSVAAGAAALGLASVAEGALQVFDHRTAPLGANVEDNYSVWDHDLAVLHMDGTYKLSTHGGGVYTFYDQNGVTTPIDAADKTATSVWFTHHDFLADTGNGLKGYDGSFAYAGDGGVAGNLITGSEDVNDLYEAYHSNDPDIGVESVATQVDGTLNYATAPGVGVAMFGNGGVSSSPGWGGSSSWGNRIGFQGPGFVGFYVDDVDGRHYGWAEVSFSWRPYGMSIHGWGYESLPGLPALLTYDPPVTVIPGDLDGDLDVDADDIDILCTNMGGDPATYDMDGDLDVDEDDMIFLVENLVELQDGSGRVGTQRGDFNLDGFVNATDLAIMNPNFGLSGQLYSDGNANCDVVINGTDLAILAGNIGFAAPTGAVPEPATLSVLALGAAGIASRRRKRFGA